MYESDSRHFLQGYRLQVYYIYSPFWTLLTCLLSAESSELWPQHSGQGRKGLVMVSSKLGWAGLQRAGYVEWRIQTLAVTFHLAISRSLALLPAYNYTRYLFLHVFIYI